MKRTLISPPLIRVAICFATIVCCADLRAVTISGGTLRANGNLIKLSTGTLAVGGIANSYTGATNITAGT